MIFLTLCSEIAGSPAISEISPAILEKFIMRFYVNTLMSIPPESWWGAWRSSQWHLTEILPLFEKKVALSVLHHKAWGDSNLSRTAALQRSQTKKDFQPLTMPLINAISSIIQYTCQFTRWTLTIVKFGTRVNIYQFSYHVSYHTMSLKGTSGMLQLYSSTKFSNKFRSARCRILVDSGG